ncbi:hypothetical protein E2C01_070985 [Portunus trituberculatus]|uniref:Uncharacterized protein n=1 Tax=Portunus trituberculatus TaxID=210409 RepID=A0A5B7I408_PORTR|nr:hypothetical protein [Portunus trituberculatus]
MYTDRKKNDRKYLQSNTPRIAGIEASQGYSRHPHVSGRQVRFFTRPPSPRGRCNELIISQVLETMLAATHDRTLIGLQRNRSLGNLISRN